MDPTCPENEAVNKYDATYKHGKTIVHVVAPKLMSEDEKKKVTRDMHMAGWAIVDEIIESRDESRIKETLGLTAIDIV